MDKKSKQEGSPDLGSFLRELGGRTYPVPRKMMKVFAQCRKTGYIWREMLKPVKKVHAHE